MTLQQLKYVTTIANIGSISEAAKRLFVSQPSLTKAIKELEKEMGITIFDRTNKGLYWKSNIKAKAVVKNNSLFLRNITPLRLTPL